MSSPREAFLPPTRGISDSRNSRNGTTNSDWMGMADLWPRMKRVPPDWKSTDRAELRSRAADARFQLRCGPDGCPAARVRKNCSWISLGATIAVGPGPCSFGRKTMLWSVLWVSWRASGYWSLLVSHNCGAPRGFVWWCHLRAAPRIWLDARDRALGGVGNMPVSLDSTTDLASARLVLPPEGAYRQMFATWREGCSHVG